MDDAEALGRLAKARVGRLATVSVDGSPHVVPITFALVDRSVAHMIDHKPKTTARLQRLSNIAVNPRASVLIDHYDEDWSTLWWVRVDGKATFETDGDRWEVVRAALTAKYPQYVESPPNGPAILVAVDRITHWEST